MLEKRYLNQMPTETGHGLPLNLNFEIEMKKVSHSKLLNSTSMVCP